MKATFENSVNVLVEAYFEGKLQFLDCTACAVGNLIAAGGYEFKGRHGDQVTDQWLRKIFCMCRGCGGYHYEPSLADEQIKYSGYDIDQLNRIELAFESGKYLGGDEAQKQFTGLMQVVDVLADIHGISLEQKSVAKAMFVKETTTP